MPQLYGIIGYPLGHSFSPQYFNQKFGSEGIDAAYRSFPIKDLADFPKFIDDHPALAGLNVTIPHKKTIIPYLDDIDPAAQEIGAVNCISISNGIKKGYNTDVLGFTISIKPLLRPHHSHALVLGTGGGSDAVAYSLTSLCIPYKKVSRQPQTDMLQYQELNKEIITACKLIINTTPLGMYPDVESYPPIPYQYLTENHLLYDLIYYPDTTTFLKLGKEKGATIKNGYEMLLLQAEASWEIWTSQTENH